MPTPATYQGKAYLGIDSGSTTVKAAVVTGKMAASFDSLYRPNNGNPVEIARAVLAGAFYRDYPQIQIASSSGHRLW